ncbi:hypothetical protein E2542_SST16116 [Spatholobus suberectus]|nr:hypothetical protein E2542_SST16116 [Spatholobus suberectus]
MRRYNTLGLRLSITFNNNVTAGMNIPNSTIIFYTMKSQNLKSLKKIKIGGGGMQIYCKCVIVSSLSPYLACDAAFHTIFQCSKENLNFVYPSLKLDTRPTTSSEVKNSSSCTHDMNTKNELIGITTHHNINMSWKWKRIISHKAIILQGRINLRSS